MGKPTDTMHHSTLSTVAATLLAVTPVVSAAGLYTKSSPVLQVDAKNYDSLIAKSNHTSVSPTAPQLVQRARATS